MQGGLYSRHRLQRRELDNVGKVPNPTTLGIFFPVMQNDDVPKKRPQARFPPGPPQRKAIQGASQGASKRRSKARPKARRPEATQGAVWAFLYKAQSRPSPYTAQLRPVQGGLYSRHRLQRKEPDNVRESSEPDNVRNLLPRYAK